MPLEIFPKDAVALGLKYLAQGDFAYARYPLEQAIQLDPNYPEAWHYLAQTYQELAKYDIAVNAITPATAKTRILDTLSKEFIDYMLVRIPRGRFLEVEEAAVSFCFHITRPVAIVSG